MIPKEICRIQKSNLEVVVVALSVYNGKNLIDVRTYANYNGDGHKPTQKGISLPVEKLHELMHSLEKAYGEARAQGVI